MVCTLEGWTTPLTEMVRVWAEIGFDAEIFRDEILIVFAEVTVKDGEVAMDVPVILISMLLVSADKDSS